MKKILALAAVAALTAGVSAYAANPFTDVSTDDWAYQAVSDLSDQGVVEGYPDGTFKGERNMTRYELAQIIARLMAKEDQLNAEQQATLDKLAGEYADELANLGVRVSNLEKKVGNLSWSGDARMQYQRNSDLLNEKSDSWTGRMRINVQGQVNDQVTVNGRLVTNMYFKDAEEDDGNTTMDRINVKWTPNDATYVTIGRQGVALDQTGTFWDEDGVFDGITAGYDNGKFGIDAGYGYLKDSQGVTGMLGDDYYAAAAWEKANGADTEAWFVKATGHIADRADISAFYLDAAHNIDGYAEVGIDDADNVYADLESVNGPSIKAWGAGATVDLGGNFTLDGDYVQSKIGQGIGNKKLWTAGLTYGEVDTDKVGSWQLGVHYVKADWGSYFLGNSALDMTDQLEYGNLLGANVHFWTARAGVALQKNVELDAYYNFAAKATGVDTSVADPEDTWGVELNYAF